ncbi:integral membrane protein [Paecilomyces variotii No. 5]|uniref:Integral membrane protein n=1 Tax=Byssochlamys spectabilis (strain No. 5 / NBRC 109023) TaxID=1356009 RepID=V5FDZ2_BYSSN|nr:integral membrane protein [Paecilomyces variotii No. 5]
MEGQNGGNDSKTVIPSEQTTELSMETPPSCSSTVDQRSNSMNDEPKPAPPTLNVEMRMSSGYLLDHQAVYRRKRGTYVASPKHHRKLRNNLLLGVGFLELANSCDFAANVWNTIPVPHFAIALMAIGGASALFTSIFAFRDLELSWMNVRFLQEERAFLRSRKQTATQHDEEKMEMISQGELDSWLSVNFRELGSELVDRFVMDLLLGSSAVIVGIGTLLAIGGANKSIYHASNLMSGYIGNAPGVLFGILNATWTGYLYVRFHRHAKAVRGQSLPDIMKDRLTDRFYMMQRHNAFSGVFSMVAGVAGMITATMWWGSLLQNWDRIGDKSVLKKLEDVISVHQLLLEEPSQAVDELITNPESLDSFLRFMFEYDLFDDFCLYLLRHAEWRRLFYGESRPDTEFSISPRNLLDADEQVLSKTLELARSFITRKSRRHFEYMERFLLEMAGCYVYSHCSAGREKRTK